MARENLQGKVALVTGASSGVGWQSAVRLAEQGVRLCVTARRVEALEKLQYEVRRQGGECLVAPGDVTVQEDVERVVRACMEYYGRVDLLVNVAAVQGKLVVVTGLRLSGVLLSAPVAVPRYTL